MGELGKYVISIIAAAAIVSICTGLVQNKTEKEILRLLGGLFLAVSILKPLTRMDIDTVLSKAVIDQAMGEEAVETGKELSSEALASIIIEKTEAYIWDKAKAMEADISVEIQLSNHQLPVPETVRIMGSISPYEKQQLSQWLEEDLGITKENQQWIS